MSDQNNSEIYQDSQGTKKSPSAKNILKNVLIVSLVIVMAMYGPGAYSKFLNSSPDNASYSGMKNDVKIYEESLKDISSDIEGMSQFDKFQMGLIPEDGSDTDGDGLSDKDEIEKYNSDPLKVSTAGDLYSDWYKVSNGLDVNEKIPYEGKQEFPGNSCPEIILNASSPTDFQASIVDVSDEESLSGREVYKAWKIYNYSGILEIDLSRILSENNISISDITIYDGDWSTNKASKANYSVKDNFVTFKKPLTDGIHIIYVTDKKLLNLGSTMIAPTVEYPKAVVKYNIASLFNKGVPKIYIKNIRDDKKQQEFINKVVSATEQMIKREAMFYKTPLYEKNEDGTYKLGGDIIAMPGYGIDAVYDGLISKFSYFKMNSDDVTDFFRFRNLLFGYFSFDNTSNPYASYMHEGEIKEGTIFNTGFDSTNDRIPFLNFGSNFSPNGNCAGITTLTAKLYNTGTVPSEGTYHVIGEKKNEKGEYENFDFGDISWNILGDGANMTLMDKYLSDYKYANWTYDFDGKFNIDDPNLSDGEKEFIKMIGCYWAELNDYWFTVPSRIENKTWYKYSMIDNICAKLDEGKILTVCIYDKNDGEDGSGHAMNIVGYEKRTDNGVVFKIYDNNTYANKPYEEGNLVISKWTYQPNPEKPDAPVPPPVFGYKYLPKNDNSFKACNTDSSKEDSIIYKFAVFDENYNLITE